MGNLADVLLVVAVIGVLVVLPSVICWLKGKKLWATLGFWTGWHWIPVFRLAKPDSWWAQRYYDEDKLRKARARFARPTTAMPEFEASSVEEFSEDEIIFQDKITRRAWEKARKREAARS